MHSHPGNESTEVTKGGEQSQSNRKNASSGVPFEVWCGEQDGSSDGEEELISSAWD